MQVAIKKVDILITGSTFYGLPVLDIFRLSFFLGLFTEGLHRNTIDEAYNSFLPKGGEQELRELLNERKISSIDKLAFFCARYHLEETRNSLKAVHDYRMITDAPAGLSSMRKRSERATGFYHTIVKDYQGEPITIFEQGLNFWTDGEKG